MRELTSADMSHEGFAFATCRDIEMGPLRVLASRISYVGDLGWELYVPIEQGARLWDLVWEAGEPHSLTACGIGTNAACAARKSAPASIMIATRRASLPTAIKTV